VLPEDLLLPFWFTLPAYAANPMAVLWGGGTPMDFGRLARDGRRLLGDGKTWRGFAGGILSGVVLGTILTAAGAAAPVLSFGPAPDFLRPVALLATGALLGDVIGAFFKRRRGLPRGAKAPGLDQYDFLLGAFLLLAIGDPGFLGATYFTGDRLFGLLLVIVITPALHRAVNIVGYRMGRKKEPW
jgi:CDP-2,3-bis-(O-geranylgeranyl)-sn-glycerol synthase